MPIAVAFERKVEVIGYNSKRSFERGIEAAIRWYKINL